MDELNKIPVPQNTGSAGSQGPSETCDIVEEARPFGGLPIAGALAGLAASNARALGGNIGSVMIAASARQMESEIWTLRQQLHESNGKVDTLRAQLEVERVKNATQEATLGSIGQTKHLRNFAITAGTALAMLPLSVGDSGLNAYTVGLMVAGLLLVFFGWWNGVKGGRS